MKYPYSRKCTKCGKEIFPTACWVYKSGSKYYCSWKCYNCHEDVKKKEIISPKVGDTIKIIRVHPRIDYYRNRVGIVEFIDIDGQLYGTWGELQIIPETDEFEIIEEKEVNDGKEETNQ